MLSIPSLTRATSNIDSCSSELEQIKNQEVGRILVKKIRKGISLVVFIVSYMFLYLETFYTFFLLYLYSAKWTTIVKGKTHFSALNSDGPPLPHSIQSCGIQTVSVLWPSTPFWFLKNIFNGITRPKIIMFVYRCVCPLVGLNIRYYSVRKPSLSRWFPLCFDIWKEHILVLC